MATLDQAAEVGADLVRRQLDQSLRPEDFAGPLAPERDAAIDRPTPGNLASGTVSPA
jgi:hypothetical protein